MNALILLVASNLLLASNLVLAKGKMCNSRHDAIRFCISESGANEGVLTFAGNTKKEISCLADIKGNKWTAKCDFKSSLVVEKSEVHEDDSDLVFRVGRYKNPETQADTARIYIDKQPHGLFQSDSFIVD
jgi:hypothetical protein